METPFPGYQKLDMETWPRREHYRYYRERLKCGYSFTTRLDVTEALHFAREHGRRFYGCFLYAAARTVNELNEMKLMVTPDGTPGIWDAVHVNFTVFHEDDKTFSDLWTEYRPDFDAFHRELERVLDLYGGNHGVKGRPGQPPNFFCISCVPWMDYTGYTTHSVGEPALFPIITYGRYAEQAGRYTLPATLTISHAAADGYHTSLFFQKLQENLRRFGNAPYGEY